MEDLKELAIAAMNHDAEAGEKLFEYLRVRFRRIAAKMLGLKRDVAVTESDLLQELNLRIWKMLQGELGFRDARHFLALAGQHLRWAALELLRRLPPRPMVSLDPGQYPAGTAGPITPAERDDPHHPDRQEAWERFHQLIDQEGILDENERMVVTLRWYEGMRQRAIAELMQVSERTVKRYWHSAKKKLRQHVDLDLLR
ncbi:MAG: sigma-70 family RNA polymerase sigma factor [Gemmatales bacterium]|nr:sigma-70 family RNA polymerase sigma factor [Gemmatales bacterium]MDW8176718.1 sigma-70 family RNA polymerase sigma factor [Gemmatales bacterium]